jgi:branched-chain amino acid transport system permease protein
MGEASALTTLFYPQMADIVIFLVMAVVLLIRPSGLFGKAGLLE